MRHLLASYEKLNKVDFVDKNHGLVKGFEHNLILLELCWLKFSSRVNHQGNKMTLKLQDLYHHITLGHQWLQGYLECDFDLPRTEGATHHLLDLI